MMRFNNPDDAANLMGSKAARASNSQGLKPELGVIAAPAFALTNMNMRRLTQVGQNEVEGVPLFAVDYWTHVRSPSRRYCNGCW
jgi:hypothetical protein